MTDKPPKQVKLPRHVIAKLLLDLWVSNDEQEEAPIHRRTEVKR